MPELLELQKPVELLSHPEERLFQTTHQAAELWLHHVDYEIGRAVELHRRATTSPSPPTCSTAAARIINLLRQQIVILETMAPADYHVIRTTSLGRGSGQESPGFAKLLDVGKRLWPVFEALLGRRVADGDRDRADAARARARCSASCRRCSTTTRRS